MAVSEDLVREELKKVIDPELFVNIIDNQYRLAFSFIVINGDNLLLRINNLSGNREI